MDNKQNIEKNNQENAFKGKKIKIKYVLLGSIAGILNGFFGGGGGMVVVPILNSIFKRDAKKSHATAILIILPLSVVSGLLYSYFGFARFSSVLPCAIGVIVGGGIGAFLLGKFTSKTVKIIFYILMFGAGIRMVI